MATPTATQAPSQPSLLQLFRRLLGVPWWPRKPRVEELGAAEGCSSSPNWEHWENASRKSHPATWAPCCPSPLQLLRGLLGRLGSLWGTRKPREEELGTAEGRSSPGQRWEDSSGESTECLLGRLEELSFGGCLVINTSDVELVAGDRLGDSPELLVAEDTLGDSPELLVAGDTLGDRLGDTPGSHTAPQPASSQGDSEEGTGISTPGYPSGDTPERIGVPPAPSDNGEAVTSPEPALSVGCDAEWEKEKLLEGEGSESPEAEVSQNRLWRASRQRRASEKIPALGSVTGREEESLLSGAAESPAKP